MIKCQIADLIEGQKRCFHSCLYLFVFTFKRLRDWSSHTHSYLYLIFTQGIDILDGVASGYAERVGGLRRRLRAALRRRLRENIGRARRLKARGRQARRLKAKATRKPSPGTATAQPQPQAATANEEDAQAQHNALQRTRLAGQIRVLERVRIHYTKYSTF